MSLSDLLDETFLINATHCQSQNCFAKTRGIASDDFNQCRGSTMRVAKTDKQNQHFHSRLQPANQRGRQEVC